MATLLLAAVLAMALVSATHGQSSVEQTSTGFYWPTGTSEVGDYASWQSNGCSWSGNNSYDTGYYHIGQDIEANEGDTVYAITDGKVIHISRNGWGTGNTGVLLEHQLDDGTSFIAVYGHILSNVQEDDDIKGGDSFATIGSYSRPHLHLGIRPGTSLVSPYGRMPCPDTGPITDTNGFVDPVEWITTKIPLGNSYQGVSDQPGFWAKFWESIQSAWEKFVNDIQHRITRWLNEKIGEFQQRFEQWVEEQAGRILRELEIAFTNWLEQQCMSCNASLLLPAIALILRFWVTKTRQI